MQKERCLAGFPKILWKPKMRKGSMVRFGWYYRRKPIHDIERPIGIVLEDVGDKWCTTEKLYMRRGAWFIKYNTDWVPAFKVLVEEKIKIMAKINLVEVKYE